MREPIRDRGRLLHIQEAINDILEYTQGITYQDLCSNKILFAGIVYKTIIIGEASHMLTQEFKDSHPDINWRAIKAMRNH